MLFGSWPMLRQHNSRNFAAIIGLAQMSRAAVTEKTVGRRIGAKRRVMDLANASLPQSLAHIAGQVEAEMASAIRRNKKAVILRAEPGAQIVTHFIVGLGNGGADGGGNAAGPGTQLCH